MRQAVPAVRGGGTAGPSGLAQPMHTRASPAPAAAFDYVPVQWPPGGAAEQSLPCLGAYDGPRFEPAQARFLGPPGAGPGGFFAQAAGGLQGPQGGTPLPFGFVGAPTAVGHYPYY